VRRAKLFPFLFSFFLPCRRFPAAKIFYACAATLAAEIFPRKKFSGERLQPFTRKSAG
jgi:hypothetical protein